MAKEDKKNSFKIPLPEAPSSHYNGIAESYNARQEDHFTHEQNIQKMDQQGLFVEIGERPVLVWRLESRRLYGHQQTENSWYIPGVADAGGFGVRYNGAPNTGPEIQNLLNAGDQKDYATLPANVRRQGEVFAHNEHQNQVWAYTNQGGNTIGTSTATNPVGASNGGTFTSVPDKGTEKTLFLNALTKGNKFVPITALFQNENARNEHHSFDDTKVVCKYDHNSRPIYTVPLKNKAGEFIRNEKGKIQTVDVRDENLQGEMKLSYIENKNGEDFFYYLDQHNNSTGYYTTKQDKKSATYVRIGKETYTTALLSQRQADGTVTQRNALVGKKTGDIHFLDEETAKTIQSAITKANQPPEYAIFIEGVNVPDAEIKSARIDASVWAGQDVSSDKSDICEKHGLSIKDIQQQVTHAQQAGEIASAHTSFEYELATTHIAMEQILCGVNLRYTGDGNKWEVTSVDRNPHIDERLLDSSILADENVRFACTLASEKVKNPEKTVILDYDMLNRKTEMDKHLGLEYLAESHNEAATRTLQDVQKIVKKVQENVNNMQQVKDAEEMTLSTLLQDIPKTISPETQRVSETLQSFPRPYSVERSITHTDNIRDRHISETIFVKPEAKKVSGNSKRAQKERKNSIKAVLQSGAPGYTEENREKIEEILNNPNRTEFNHYDLPPQVVSDHISHNIEAIKDLKMKEMLADQKGEALATKIPKRPKIFGVKVGPRKDAVIGKKSRQSTTSAPTPKPSWSSLVVKDKDKKNSRRSTVAAPSKQSWKERANDSSVTTPEHGIK